MTSTGKPHIKYVVNNTKDIINKVIPYFSFIYGQKRLYLAKFPRIYFFSNVLSNTFDKKLANELIHLVYSPNPEGQKGKISLTEKLFLFNCST